MGTWVGRTVVDIAAAVRAGEVSPVEVVDQHLQQVDRLEPEVGAFVTVRREAARVEAAALAVRVDLASLPLAGVPVAIKDNIAVAGEPTRFGARVTPDTPARHDHEVVQRLRAAGAVVLGITRMPELGVWGTSEDAFGGVARNPWHLDRTPGGSSGGSGAAVAAAMVPVAHGNDGLGSIRIPAACCGLVGVKPGADVVPSGVGRTSWRGLAENGPLATTVEDAALVLSVMAGRPDLAAVAPPSGSLRIAASTTIPLPGVRIDPQITATFLAAVTALRQAGHETRRADPPYTRATANAIIAWYTASTADETAAFDEALLEPRQRGHARVGRAMLRLGRVRQRDRDRWQQQVAAFFGGHDLLVTPMMSAMPPAASGWRERSWQANLWGNARWVPYPGAWNFARCPALTVPIGMHSSGMPIGIQVVGPVGSEALLLSLAVQLETLLPWPRHAPLAGQAGLAGVDR
jgi:amidase